MAIMIDGSVYFLICAKDILNLINYHCNKKMCKIFVFHSVFFLSVHLLEIIISEVEYEKTTDMAGSVVDPHS